MSGDPSTTETRKSIAFVRSHITRMVTFGVILTLGACFSLLYMKQPIILVLSGTVFMAIAFIVLLWANLGYLLKVIEESCMKDVNKILDSIKKDYNR